MSWRVTVGDSRDSIPEQHFHLIVTSPPYNVGKDYADHDDVLTVDEWRAMVTSVLEEAWDRLVDGGRMAINVQHGVGRSPMIPIAHHVEAIGHELPGALYRGCIIWDKGSLNSTAWGSWLSPSNPVLRGQYEQILVWSKEQMHRSGGPADQTESEFMTASADVWKIGVGRRRVDHPAPFPVALAERLIKLYTWPGDRVLDPFAGIGTSGVAAKRLGRSWVGIDTSEAYCRIARDRLRVEPTLQRKAPELTRELRTVAEEFATVLAAGAHHAGTLAVFRAQLGTGVDHWERYRRTLSNQVKIGAYGVVRRQDLSRVFWVTDTGGAQLPTLRRWTDKPVRKIRASDVGQLAERVFADVAGVLVHASSDRRTRAVTARGFTPTVQPSTSVR